MQMLLTAVAKGRSVFNTEIAMTKSANGYQCQNTFIAVLREGATATKPLCYFTLQTASILNAMQSGARLCRAPFSTARKGLQGSH